MFNEPIGKMIPLEFERNPPQRFDIAGTSYSVAEERLRVRFSLFGPPDVNREPPKCVVDTGSSVTIIPRKFWQAHKQQITWTGSSTRVRLLGGIFPAEFGLVEMWVFDISGRERMMLNIVAACTKDGSDGIPAQSHALFGLSGGGMSSGGLCLNYFGGEAFLIKV